MTPVINILTPDLDFSYDIHSLAAAFFPMSQIRVMTGINLNSLDAKAAGDKYINVAYLALDGFYMVKVFFYGTKFPKTFDTAKSDSNGVCEKDGAFLGRVADDGVRLSHKNIIKQVLFCFLSFHTKKILPWGSLTGIRPSKLALSLILKSDYESALLKLKEVYYVSEYKAKLAADVAVSEHRLKGQIDANGYSLYVGIPFCKSICNYCSFGSNLLPKEEQIIEDYINCLEIELENVARIFNGRVLNCVYIGGGTPSALNEGQLERVFRAIEKNVDTKNALEMTFEAGRPDCITRKKLTTALEYGYKRICLNPQSMNDETLARIGRGHRACDIISAYNLARECGYRHINMDMIIGLMGEGEGDIKASLKAVLDLAPDSVTLHTLSIKRGSQLKETLIDSGSQLSDCHINTHVINDMANHSFDSLCRAGYSPYYMYRQKNTVGNLENVGFAKPDKQGFYNVVQMQDVHSIAAIGAGSISKNVDNEGNVTRAENVKDLRSYMERVKEMGERKKRLFLGG